MNIMKWIIIQLLIFSECLSKSDYPENEKQYEPCYFAFLNGKLSDDSQISPHKLDIYLINYLARFGYKDIDYKFTMDCKCYLVFKNSKGKVCNLFRRKDDDDRISKYRLDCDKFGKMKPINRISNQMKTKKLTMKLGQVIDYKFKYKGDDMEVEVEYGQNAIEKRNVPYFRLMF